MGTPGWQKGLTEQKMDKKLKVTILCENWGDEGVIPEPPRRRRGPTKHKKKREKHDFEEIFEALEKLGHEPSYEVLDGTDKTLLPLPPSKTTLFSNLLYSYA